MKFLVLLLLFVCLSAACEDHAPRDQNALNWAQNISRCFTNYHSRWASLLNCLIANNCFALPIDQQNACNDLTSRIQRKLNKLSLLGF